MLPQVQQEATQESRPCLLGECLKAAQVLPLNGRRGPYFYPHYPAFAVLQNQVDLPSLVGAKMRETDLGRVPACLF